ncbi:ABC transporter permease [Acidicapsa acidisoli]|uniref:ABC transporter permease n=1 Tax=Acidicapsa acidisoli TaxID=1615681 RepID=UPI0021E0E613|nr:ABC transporter permease subunit [Acidicapsa acidisoli]
MSTIPVIGHIVDIQGRPRRLWTQSLSWVLFLVGIFTYTHFSVIRHKENPEDRVIPSGAQLWQGIQASVLEPAEEDDALDPSATTYQRITHSMLWKDTISSSRRFFIAIALLVPAILIGLHMAVFPYAEAFFLRFVLFFDKIVALSLLPILFIVFGIDEWSKIMLMVIGVGPTLMLDTYNIAKSVPREQAVKAFTLKSSNLDVAYRVILKQILPQVINSVRLNLKPLALFLFAGEMIASTDGLAYRIAIMRRHMGMDIIIPYLLWVAVLLFGMDVLLRVANRRLHPWC